MPKNIKKRIYPPMYSSWRSMKQRCNNPKHKDFYLWGGRGITYDPNWETFTKFAKDMRESYSKGLQIDRIDNNKGYYKDNCRWATSREQNNNRRDNKLYSFKGVIDNLSNWSEALGIKRSTLSQRLHAYKWSIERTLSEGMDI